MGAELCEGTGPPQDPPRQHSTIGQRSAGPLSPPSPAGLVLGCPGRARGARWWGSHRQHRAAALGGRGLTGPQRSGKSAAAGLQAGAWGKRGWAQLASMSSSSGTGRDALPATCQRDPDTPRACARPAGFFPSTVFGGCRAAGYRSTGLRMRCPHPVASWMPWKGEAGEVPPVGLRPAVLEEKAPGPGGRRNLWLFLAWLAARRQVGAAGLHHSPRAACRASTVCCANRSPAAGGLRGWLQSPDTRVPGCVWVLSQHSDNRVPERPAGTRRYHQLCCSPCTDTTAAGAGCTQSPKPLQGSELCAASFQGAAGPRGHAGLASFCPWGATRLRALSGISAGSGRNAAAEGTMRHLAPVLSVTRSAAAARAQPCTQGAGRMQMEMTLVAVSCGRMRPAFSSSAPDAEPGALGGSALCRRAEQCPLPVT